MDSLDGLSSRSSISSIKKTGKRIWYPFGTSSYTHYPYSEFCHLSGDTKEFAISLATATDIHAEVIDEEAMEMEKRRMALVRKNLMAKLSSIYNKSSNQSQHGNDNSPPCRERACQEMIKAVASARTIFKVENIEIQKRFEELSNELNYSESTLLNLKDRKSQIIAKGDELEEMVKRLKGELDKKVDENMELIAERDSFQGKFIHYEYKIQSLMRQSQEASAVLYKMLWGDDVLRKVDKSLEKSQSCSNNNSGNANNGVHDAEDNHNDVDKNLPLQIKQCDEKTIAIHNSPSITSYNSLATTHVVDFAEKLKKITKQTKYKKKSITLPSLSVSMNGSMLLKPSLSSSSLSKKQYLKKLEGSSSSSSMHKYDQNNSNNNNNNSELLPIKSKNINQNIFSKDSKGTKSLNHQLSTWSQSRSLLENSEFEKIELLDPVFFRESAGFAAYRGSKVGKVRESFDDSQVVELLGRHGLVNGVLLTSKHPGLDLTAMKI